MVMARSAMKALDSRQIELIGRYYLTAELMRFGLEVAVPVRDRGVDLIVYDDLGKHSNCYRSRPVQLKAAWAQSFAIDSKYEKFPDLLLAYIWDLRDPRLTKTYLMSYSEAQWIGDQMGWLRTASWAKGTYVTTRPSAKLRRLLEPFTATAAAWQGRLQESGANQHG
jgi:hypothetical protein